MYNNFHSSNFFLIIISSLPAADCGTDHHLLCLELRMELPKCKRTSPKTTRLNGKAKIENFGNLVQGRLPAYQTDNMTTVEK